MSQLPTYWFQTEHFWRGRFRPFRTYSYLLTPLSTGYPHWDMLPDLKRYYLMQSAYWCQQLIVLLLRLEKPRKDYSELVAHHFVTLWLVGYVPA